MSDRIVQAMQNQPSRVAAAAQAAPPTSYSSANSTQPNAVYVPPAQSSTVYVIPDTQTYGYYAPYGYPYVAEVHAVHQDREARRHAVADVDGRVNDT